MPRSMFAALGAFALINAAVAGDNMKIQINGTDYVVQTEDNETVTDIVAHLPMSMELVRYAGHEYYVTLPFTPREAAAQTSKLGVGHVYYWGGGNAFVINFAEYDIAPYHSVHIGKIVDAAAVDVLGNASGKVAITVTK